MGIKFSNNASSNITHALTVDAISVSITPGTGDLFPYIIEGTDYFYATLAGNNGLEIVKVTNRILDTMTIERAQDGTNALLFNPGDLFELRIVAADFEDTFAKVDSMLEEAIEENTSIVNSALANKAPTSHASDNTTYGVGTGDVYGHVKLSDDASELYDVSEGIAATPLAVNKAKNDAVDEAVSKSASDSSVLVSSLDSTLRTFIKEKTAEYLPLVGGTLTGWLTGKRYQQKLEDIDVTEDPTEDKYGQPIIFKDKNDNTFASIQPTQWSSGGNALRMITCDKTGAQGTVLTVETTAAGGNVCSVAGQHVARKVNGQTANANGEVRIWAINKGNVSANTLTEAGTYYVNGANTALPSGTNGYIVVEGTSASSALRQIFYRTGTVNSNEHNIYTRARASDGTWGSWVKMLTGKDVTAYVTTTYVSGTKGYRKWSDGFIEQWGRSTTSGGTITLPTAFKNTNYCITLSTLRDERSSNNESAGSLTTTNFQIYTAAGTVTFWYACGF